MQKDITDQKRVQEQLFQADKMVAIGTLVSGVAHEINNPTNFITLNTSTLAEVWESVVPVLDEYYQRNDDFVVGGLNYSEMRGEIPGLLAGIIEGGDRIKNIVGDLKEFVRIVPSEFSKDVDVNAVIKSTVNLVRPQIKEATKHFSVEYAKNLPPVTGNFQKLQQVVINLIQNACHALPDKSKALKIKTEYVEEAKTISIRVRDEGTGISEDAIHRVTEPFFTTKRDSGGTGLGLSVSLGIVQDHGGTLNFASQPGEGTTAVVMIPVRK